MFLNRNVTTPLEQLVLVPCANGGSGELVLLSGEIHDVLHVIFDGRGGVHVEGQDNWQGVSGIGQITGAKYQGTRADLTVFNGRVGEVSTQKSNMRVVGQGSGNNFVVHSDLSIRVNANGIVTVSRDEYSAECN